MRRGLLSHELIGGDRVPFRGPDPAAREPNAAAIVMMAQPVGMVQPTDRRDVGAMPLERLQDA